MNIPDFNYSDVSYDKVEIDITYKCNLNCANCDRLAGMFDFGDTDMTMGQIDFFIQEVRQAKHKISKVIVLGGEPLVHPRFLDIWFNLYNNLARPKIIDQLALITNGILALPKELSSCQYGLAVAPAAQKLHKFFYVAPIDIGAEMRPCCNPNGPKDCGITLNTFGYFPCGSGGSIARLFNLSLAKHHLPESLAEWDYNEICVYCAHANAHPTIDTIDVQIEYSETFRAKIQEFQGHVFDWPKYPNLKKFM